MSGYEFFEENFLEKLKADDLENINYSLVPYDTKLSDQSNGINLYGANIAFWLLENSVDNYWIMSISRYYEGGVFVLDDAKIATKFRVWLKDYEATESGYRHLWYARKDWLKKVEETGRAALGGKVEYPLYNYDENKQCTKWTFKIWIWMKKYIQGEVYRWDETFFFENEKDAIHFKLVWYKGDEDDS